jgi:hypothetical protein
LAQKEDERRRYGLTPTKEELPHMTMEERIAAVKK